MVDWNTEWTCTHISYFGDFEFSISDIKLQIKGFFGGCCENKLYQGKIYIKQNASRFSVYFEEFWEMYTAR